MTKSRRWPLLIGALAAVGAVGSGLSLLPGWLGSLGRLTLVLAGLLLAAWLFRLAWRRLLWRVGRRLAFSYFLVGVLPIPIVALLALLALYLLSGFFLGHLYRDAAHQLELRLEATAEAARLRLEKGAPLATDGEFGLATYRQGRRVGGDSRAPESWPTWMAASGPDLGAARKAASFVALGDGSVALVRASEGRGFGVLAIATDRLEADLRSHLGFSVSLLGPDDPRRRPVTVFEIGGRRYPMQPVRIGTSSSQDQAYFALFPPAAETPGWRERPLLQWVELAGALRDLASGAEVADYVAVSLLASPEAVRRHLLSASGEVDTSAWLAFLVVAGVLLDIYVIAAAVALFMIFGLSRAVNRLSRATDAVRQGEFGYRIPVRRRDQLGELQRSFNEMAAHLGELIETKAQKEALDKELALARRLQQDLLPRETLRLPGVSFATHFEPSAAIGGDYFDLLRAAERTLAVVIADVSGHGLPAGLRMAMVKAALRILVENGDQPRIVLKRLGDLVRSEREGRTFVTATLAFLDLDTGLLRLTNAGHPPCYRVDAAGAVDEIALPSPPLGLLSGEFAERELSLAAGDSVLWLSDGLIESRDAAGEPFGYERVAATLAESGGDAATLKERLLAAVERHTGGRPAEDDRTIVALTYRPVAASTPSSA